MPVVPINKVHVIIIILLNPAIDSIRIINRKTASIPLHCAYTVCPARLPPNRLLLLLTSGGLGMISRTRGSCPSFRVKSGSRNVVEDGDFLLHQLCC